MISAALASCQGSESGNESKTDNKDKVEKTDNEAEKENPSDKEATKNMTSGAALPMAKDFKASNDAFDVEEEMAKIDHKIDGVGKVRVVLTEEHDMVLDVMKEGGSTSDSYVLDIGEFNSFGTVVKLEWLDEKAGDLLIMWETSDGNNGMYSGYEMERRGVMHVNILTGMNHLDLVYLDHYASYEGSENPEGDPDDYHAKIDENSTWEICRWEYKMSRNGKSITLMLGFTQQEAMDDCVLGGIEDGTYTYQKGKGWTRS